MNEVNFGQYALPIVLMVILSVFYKVSPISNRAKPLLAIGLGIALGIVGLFYNGVAPTFKALVDYILYGFMAGCSAVGLWEGFSAIKNGKGIPQKLPLIIFTIFLSVSLLSCAGELPWRRATVSTFELVGTAVIVSKDSAIVLYQNGIMPDAKLEQAKELYNKAVKTYSMMGEILKKAGEVESAVARDELMAKYDILLLEFKVLSLDIIKLVNDLKQ